MNSYFSISENKKGNCLDCLLWFIIRHEFNVYNNSSGNTTVFILFTTANLLYKQNKLCSWKKLKDEESEMYK